MSHTISVSKDTSCSTLHCSYIHRNANLFTSCYEFCPTHSVCAHWAICSASVSTGTAVLPGSQLLNSYCLSTVLNILMMTACISSEFSIFLQSSKNMPGGYLAKLKQLCGPVNKCQSVCVTVAPSRCILDWNHGSPKALTNHKQTKASYRPIGIQNILFFIQIPGTW